MNDPTKASLIQFLDMMINNGWVNSATGGAMRTATKKILSVVADDANVHEVDVATALRQYNNLHPGELSPDSLRVYESRVTRAIRQFEEYKEDPKSFKPSGRPPTNGKPAKQNGDAGKKKAAQATPDAAPSNSMRGAAAVSSSAHAAFATDLNLALPFPLRPNYLAQVVIPRDLTKDEATRLCAFIQALAQAN
ncbi:hypothetical protein [Hydrogenophaga sp.]|uniref:hypothetical protein n=1 Tax=Hydrogenophaga sp. TaxID=1904254 RepID=UPI00271D00AE|nr:hypothetical protein [Hydrogenophaga sp.]MDO9507628.1 hypothetical protein [Hydrogenophaga sp.]